jgi:DnaK suppressor protein
MARKRPTTVEKQLEDDTGKTMSERTDIDTKKLKTWLQARRRELLKRVAADQDALKPVEVDQSTTGRLSRMDALQSQAMDIEIERRRQRELQRIDAALLRINEGTYGYCVACGEEIAAKRIENDPTTPVCINCAQDLPANG